MEDQINQAIARVEAGMILSGIMLLTMLLIVIVAFIQSWQLVKKVRNWRENQRAADQEQAIQEPPHFRR